MVEIKIENLKALAEEIALDQREVFASEHVALAMDRIIPALAYNDGTPDRLTNALVEADSVEDKCEEIGRTREDLSSV